jgi:predicted amidohydrolase YtcJ
VSTRGGDAHSPSSSNLSMDLDGREEAVDLSGLTVLPESVAAHVHLFLYPYLETLLEDQVTDKRVPRRLHARSDRGACKADALGGVHDRGRAS